MIKSILLITTNIYKFVPQTLFSNQINQIAKIKNLLTTNHIIISINTNEKQLSSKKKSTQADYYLPYS